MSCLLITKTSLNDVFAPLFSSQYDENDEKHLIAFDIFSPYDEEESNVSDASLGIIGSADGPTAIIVGKSAKTIVIDK